MSTVPPTLEAAVRAHSACKTTAAGFFSQLMHRPSGELVRFGFRCFACTEQALLAAFQEGGLVAVAALPPALDADGQPAINRVRLELAFTPGGGIVGAQPLRYKSSASAPAAAPIVLEGAAAAPYITLARRPDQTLR